MQRRREAEQDYPRFLKRFIKNSKKYGHILFLENETGEYLDP